ncbi:MULTISPECIES: DUF2790 domain-containing protein [Pseudomonadaceae]|nr:MULTISPECIES: DUF2790 domain-containing protein [Pseudomonas]
MKRDPPSGVPVVMVYEDSQGTVHKMRYLEWGGSTLSNG